ncbi:terminase small subunit [Weissella tructae]
MDIKEQAKADYLAGMKYKDIAAKHDIPESTIKSWKSRGKWTRSETKKDATKSKKVAKKVASKNKVADDEIEPDVDEYGLSPKERKLADEYIATGNKYQSAIKAGYSESYARTKSHKILEKASVKRYVDDCLANLSKSTIMGAEAMEFLTSVVRGEVKETVVVGGKYGLEETEKEADIKTRISATKELLKRHPENDKLTAAKVRKLEAEADMAEYQRDYITGADVDTDDDGSSLIDAIEGSDVNENDETTQTENEV